MILPFLGLGNPLGLPGGLASGFLGRPWDRKTIGKPWGKSRKTIGKWWFNGMSIMKISENISECN